MDFAERQAKKKPPYGDLIFILMVPKAGLANIIQPTDINIIYF